MHIEFSKDSRVSSCRKNLYLLIYFILLRPLIKVDTLYFVPKLSVKDASSFLMDFIKLCKFIYPEAKTMEAPYEGVKDSTRKKKEIRSRKLWKATKVGYYRTHDKVLVVNI